MQKTQIQLDRILLDIAKEKALHPFNTRAEKKDVDDAWARVGKNNNLSVHESRSIFKVLQKKYDQEKQKPNSSWKLFAIMHEIHKKEAPKYESSEEQNGVAMDDEDEEYEMLDVQEDEKTDGGNIISEDESSVKSTTSTSSPKSDKNVVLQKQNNQTTTNSSQQTVNEEKKVLNSLIGNQKIVVSGQGSNMAQTPTSVATAAALQKKGITMKKTIVQGSTPSGNRQIANTVKTGTPLRSGAVTIVENTKSVQLSETLKRKLTDDLSNSVSSTSIPQFKKIHIGRSASPTTPKTAGVRQNSQLTEQKQENEENEQKKIEETGSQGINVITIPGNPQISLANGPVEPSSSTPITNAPNGFTTGLETVTIKNELVFEDKFEGNKDNVNGVTQITSNPGDIINFGNFDNSLPPTFFKNLCNSTRHEALGLYVANVMNRLSARSASKLELKILKALIDIQAEDSEEK